MSDASSKRERLHVFSAALLCPSTIVCLFCGSAKFRHYPLG